ncbi:2-dehydropantoate 2-reductase [Bacillus sp. ISL-18]|uniref:2-dehydropantoate 2-reductase n=1 Tax=Bacillus sp. ISL-18 TaxID=2819118 RepID=UPI001BEC78D4|nr:2-dehydropantoate 2-reductase [Bacillus sp. ISL-18]MBT2654261.1 2-dehydropantoate 2-reductase [Bacillus sp. ISL-18]
MRVGIIGAGSIGLLFAAYLSRVFDVTVYTRSQEQANEINLHGISLLNRMDRTVAVVKAVPITDWQGSEELTIIAVKQYQLFSFLERLKQIPVMPENLLFLQNGMGHLKLLNDLKGTNVYVGSVEHGALRENLYTVRHNGAGTTNVAVYKGDSEFLQWLTGVVSKVFPMTYQEEYFAMLEKKLIANAMINPLTAILQVKNGVLVDNPFYYKILQNLFGEITAILNLQDPEEYWGQVIKICQQTADNRSSMLKDIEANRQTEIDAILGYLLEEACRKGITSPQLETLFYLIKGKESQGER